MSSDQRSTTSDAFPALDILALAAHRDDVEQTCGGTLLKMAERGYRTGILDLTQGEMGTRGTAEDRASEAAEAARRLGFFGKSAIHPAQVPIINEVFMNSTAEVAWAERVLAAFEAAGGAATKLPDGEFVDKAVAERARRLLSNL